MQSSAAGIVAGLVTGVLLRFVVALEPVWWLAWLAPAALLLIAFTGPARRWRWLTLLAAFIAVSGNVPYYLRIAPAPIVLLIVTGQTLLWLFVVAESRRAYLRWRAPWTALAYPVMWVALDTLMAAILPDGDWGSLAYTQADVLPIIQTASLFGVAGVLFLVTLIPSSIATAIALGRVTKGTISMLAASAALLTAAILFGNARLSAPTPIAPVTRFGLASVDDPIGLRAKAPYILGIRTAYDRHIAALAAEGARVVVLPEKIAVASPSAAADWQAHFAAQAKANSVWLSAGMAVQTPQGIVNDAWLFTPGGELSASYRKHFLAPPERDYVRGHAYITPNVEGTRYGIAICKDMHFASLGRAYGQRHPAVMIVPAWDFTVDRWMGARMTAVRGIENGYTVVRAAREGLLSVTDARGRILAEQLSAPLPGRRLRVDAPVPPQVATLYMQVGNVLGWTCVALAALLVWRTRIPQRRTKQ